VFMEDLDAVVGVLLALKSREVEFHIDDFGTGYSSLSYLHRLPTEVLKIDRSFVGRMGQAGDDGVIVRTIVELAHNLGRRVIAEGVETAEQLARLRALGCEHAQGFYFARGLPSSEAEPLLDARPRW
jgi:EAL domain-containing protein (putative c-di-GMP-specific phosphodiesterase class I)